MGVRDIFDDLQVVLACDRQDRIHVARVAAVVHRHDGFRAIGNVPLDVGRVYAKCAGIDVGEHNGRADRVSGHGAGPVGDAGHDHLVATTDTDGVHGRHQRHRAVRISKRMLDALPCGVFVLKLAGDIDPRHRTCAEHFENRLFVFVGDDRPVEKAFVLFVDDLGAALYRKLLAGKLCQ